MALTIKQLNGDASFLLSFEPIVPCPSPTSPSRDPFTILLDPWISGPSKILHSRFSLATHRQPACIASLAELPSPPDLVIISQHKSDHCNEATLRQLPASGTSTLILAEPSAAKVIRGWKYFDRDKVRPLPRWEDPRLSGRQTVIRVGVPSHLPGGKPGEVTVSYIPQRRDIKSLHAAIAITYRPPPSRRRQAHGGVSNGHGPCSLVTPPQTPGSNNSSPIGAGGAYAAANLSPATNALLLAMPTPPSSPPGLRPLRSVRSTASLSPRARDRAVSIIFSPHGISYQSLERFATSHLVSEAALPLTALLHCFDAVSNPWWFGGNISAGLPAGQHIATALGARAWVSTHDGQNKDLSGLVTRVLRTRRYDRDEVAGVVCSPEQKGQDHSVSTTQSGDKQLEEGLFAPMGQRDRRFSARPTEVIALGVGQEVVLTSEGLWDTDP